MSFKSLVEMAPADMSLEQILELQIQAISLQNRIIWIEKQAKELVEVLKIAEQELKRGMENVKTSV